MKEYWPENITKKSWERLQNLTKEFDFILIGGWAVYLYTKLHKSRDIDIIVDLPTLYEIRERYPLIKNERLKKYEIKEEGFDIDIYVPYFSDIGLKVEDILKEKPLVIDNIKVVPPELLLYLKLYVFEKRKGNIKGGKDEIDIIGLLMKVDIDFNKLKSYSKDSIEKLISIVNNFDKFEYLGVSYVEYKKWKKNLLDKLKKH